MLITLKTLQYTTPHRTTLRYLTLHYNTPHYTTLHYATYTTAAIAITTATALKFQLHYATLQLQLQLHYATLHPAVRVKWPLQPLQPLQTHNSNHLSLHQPVRSAIHDSQQRISPIGFLFCAYLATRMDSNTCAARARMFSNFTSQILEPVNYSQQFHVISWRCRRKVSRRRPKVSMSAA